MAEPSEETIRRIAHAVVIEALSVTKSIPREEASAIAVAAARTAVQEAHVKMFAQLGFDLANMKDVDRLRKSFTFLEVLRGGTSAIGQAVAIAVAVTIVGAALTAIWLGAKFALMAGTAVGK